MQMNQAMKKSNPYQFIDNFFIYTFTALTCSLFCSSPFWFPSLCSSMEVFLFVSLPRVGPLLVSPKVLFFVGNLIVVILIRESKLSASDDSPPGDVYYDEYISRSTRSVGHSPNLDENKGKPREIPCFEENVKEKGENIVKERWVEEEVEVVENGKEDLNGEDHEFAFPAEELSKRADDFIARVNRRRRLEAFL